MRHSVFLLLLFPPLQADNNMALVIIIHIITPPFRSLLPISLLAFLSFPILLLYLLIIALPQLSSFKIIFYLFSLTVPRRRHHLHNNHPVSLHSPTQHHFHHSNTMHLYIRSNQFSCNRFHQNSTKDCQYTASRLQYNCGLHCSTTSPHHLLTTRQFRKSRYYWNEYFCFKN